jgi:bacterioferritin-associated ferredoxin
MYMCLCKGITKSDVKRAGANGYVTPEQLTAALGLEDDDCCGSCLVTLDEFVATAQQGWTWAQQPAGAQPGWSWTPQPMTA